jgi:hypothetical protein
VLLHNTLGKGGASPSRCIPSEQGAFAPPCTHDEEPGPVPATSPNRAPVGCTATACPVASTIREPCPPIPPRQAFAPDTTTSALPRRTGSMSAAPAPRLVAVEPQGGETRAGETVIQLPVYLSQPEAQPRREPGRHTGAMKGRHFGPKPVAEPRTAWLTMRCTPAFRASVLAAADQAGLSLADYVHERLGGQPSRRARRRPGPDEAAVARIMGGLGRSGNNLNQLLRRVNSYDFGGIPELIEMLKEMTAAHAAHHTLVAAIKADLGV